MDPLGTVTTVISVINYLVDVANKTQQNRAECVKLGEHARALLSVLERKGTQGELGTLSRDIAKQLQPLLIALREIASTLEELHNKPRIKRILWRQQIADKIEEAYQHLQRVAQIFHIESKIDIQRVQLEHEDARRQDAELFRNQFEKVLGKDQDIISMLELQRTEIQEAMLAMNSRLSQIGTSIERTFLESSLNALERRTGVHSAPPDRFQITSLDVIVHEHQKLGTGGFGQVYVGDWHGAAVAIKVFERGVPQSVMDREIGVWKQLSHPHILQFHGACSIADPPFAVCALKANGDALAYLSKYPTADRHKLLHEASLGLVYLHARGVIHGDIKASNILVDEHGVACLADFGLSQIKTSTTTLRTGGGPAGAASTAGTGPTFGTARWAAPEQMALGVLSRATDAYSFGMAGYEVFALAPPFAHTPDALLFAVVVEHKLRPPRPEGLDAATWALVEQCWKDKPPDRPAAPEIVTLLKSIIGDRAVTRLQSDAFTSPSTAGPSGAGPEDEDGGHGLPSPPVDIPLSQYRTAWRARSHVLRKGFNLSDPVYASPPPTPPQTYPASNPVYREGTEFISDPLADDLDTLNADSDHREIVNQKTLATFALPSFVPFHRERVPAEPEASMELTEEDLAIEAEEKDEAPDLLEQISDLCPVRGSDIKTVYPDLRLPVQHSYSPKSIESRNWNVVFTTGDATGKAIAFRRLAVVRPLKGILLSVISASKLPEHPNLVKHDAPFLTLPENGVGAPSLWVPMEHLPWSLAEEIGQHLRRPMPILEERIIAQMTLDVAQGLSFMHANSIIHRNLSSFAVRVDKKANMEPRTWKISDFGHCKRLTPEAPEADDVVGEPHWMSPERARRQPYGPKADIWALGIILIETIEGRPPYAGWLPSKVLLAIAETAPVLRSPERVSRALKTLLSKCLIPHVPRRASAEELVKNLQIMMSRGHSTLPTDTSRSISSTS